MTQNHSLCSRPVGLWFALLHFVMFRLNAVSSPKLLEELMQHRGKGVSIVRLPELAPGLESTPDCFLCVIHSPYCPPPPPIKIRMFGRS